MRVVVVVALFVAAVGCVGDPPAAGGASPSPVVVELNATAVARGACVAGGPPCPWSVQFASFEVEPGNVSRAELTAAWSGASQGPLHVDFRDGDYQTGRSIQDGVGESPLVLEIPPDPLRRGGEFLAVAEPADTSAHVETTVRLTLRVTYGRSEI